MPVDLKISEQATQNLNTHAVREFQSAVQHYAEDLLGEANRLEAATKSTRGTPEITSTMIVDANILLRRGYSRPPKGRLLIASQVASAVGGFLTGILADAEKLKQPGGLTLFVLVLVVTITATVLALLKD